MYADNTVLFSENVHDLQNMLNNLKCYVAKWNLKVNTDKTKVVIFRNSKQNHDYEVWYYNNCKLEVVDSFCYLSVYMKYNGKHFHKQKQLSSQAQKAMFALFRKIDKFMFNTETTLSLYDTYVGNILNYACNIWGFHKSPGIEKVN